MKPRKSKKKSRRQPLSPVQRLFIRSIRIGMDYPGAMEACGVNSGHIAAWKRWNHNFRSALIKAHDKGKPIRRQMRALAFLIQECGSAFHPSSDIQKILHAHARVRGCGRMRA